MTKPPRSSPPPAPRSGERPGERSGRRWEDGALRGLSWVAYPGMAGLACTLISLGVVTWVPALAATAITLRRWREAGDDAVFTGVFIQFKRLWPELWKHGVVVGVAGVVLALNLAFLATSPTRLGLAILAVQLGLALVLLTYQLCFAAVVARYPEETPFSWRRLALATAFGGWTGPLVLLSAILVTVVSLPLGVGPALFSPSLPVILALHLMGRADSPSSHHTRPRR